ncbi:MAG: GYDIA family GHMP kinase [Bacteroidota bacterium]
MSKQFYSNGKLLITGEYTVLDGALSFAVPTTYGQSLNVEETESQKLVWKSHDPLGHVWFQTSIPLTEVRKPTKNLPKDPIQKTLLSLLSAAKRLNPQFLQGPGYAVETQMDFPRDWGLGSSSTLINNIAQWGQVNAFDLLWSTFPGSGYDIACAQYHLPILYQVKDRKPHIIETKVSFPFTDLLYFVHLNKKQDSREGIVQYRKRNLDGTPWALKISKITEGILQSGNITDFEAYLREHEQIMSQVLELRAIKQQLFPDYPGAIKSLGAWGGDFILATGREAPSYFPAKGYSTIVPFDTMVRQS